MPVTKCRCPECDTLIKPDRPVPEGKRIECPGCGESFVVTDAEAIQTTSARAERSRRRAPIDDEDDDRDDRDRVRSRRRSDWDDDEDEDDDDFDRGPRRRRSRKKESNVGLLVGLIIGGVVLAALFGVGGYFAWRAITGNSNVTRQNWDSLRVGMTREQVETVLGSGRSAELGELSDDLGPLDATQGMQTYQPGRDHLFKWKNKGNRIYAWFNGPDKSATMGGGAFISREGGDRVSANWKTPNGDVNMGFGGNPFAPPAGNPFVNPGAAGNPIGMKGNGQFTKQDYDRVQKGMTEAQLQALLGPPTLVHDNFGGPNRKALHYHGQGVAGIVVVNNGIVESK